MDRSDRFEYDDVDEIRLAQFETLVETTAPPPPNPVVCSCNRCRYGPRYETEVRTALETWVSSGLGVRRRAS